MNRIDRLSAILIHLQSKRLVKAQEIADRFEVSLRTVYRDVRSLEEAGVPVIGEAGLGYSLMNGYRLPPVMFTQEEALAFLTAEKLISKLTDDMTDSHFKSAMFKIKAVLRTPEKDLLENLEQKIEIIGHSQSLSIKPKNDIFSIILQSISDKRILNLEYFSINEEQNSERNIEPIGICYINNHWHLIAFCQLRNDYRDFRVDRIIQLTPTAKTFQGKPHLSLQNYLEQISEKQKLTTITLKVEKTVLRHIQEQKYFYGFVEEKPFDDQYVILVFLTFSIDFFARWFLIFAEFSEIIAPFALQEKMKELVNNLSIKFP